MVQSKNRKTLCNGDLDAGGVCGLEGPKCRRGEDARFDSVRLDVPPQLERHVALLPHGVGQLPQHDPLVKGRLRSAAASGRRSSWTRQPWLCLYRMLSASGTRYPSTQPGRPKTASLSSAAVKNSPSTPRARSTDVVDPAAAVSACVGGSSRKSWVAVI